MMEYDTFATHTSKDAGVFDDLIESGMSTFRPEDQESFYNAFNRESLLRAYRQGKKIVEHRGMQIGDDGEYRMMRTSVVFAVDEGSGDICEITLARSEEFLS